MRSYVDAWRRAFDHRGRSDRQAFWWAALAAVSLDVAVVAAVFRLAGNDGPPCVALTVVRMVALAQSVRMTTLLVRRFRDAGVPALLAVLAWVPAAWMLDTDLLAPHPDNDEGPATFAGGIVVEACLDAMAVLACLRSKGEDPKATIGKAVVASSA